MLKKQKDLDRFVNTVFLIIKFWYSNERLQDFSLTSAKLVCQDGARRKIRIASQIETQRVVLSGRQGLLICINQDTQ